MLQALFLENPCGATDVGPEQAVSALMSAWNQHDPHAFASQFTPDATFVNGNGWLWIGQKEIEDRHARAGIFKSSHAEIKPQSLRFLGADAALVHVSWTISPSASGDFMLGKSGQLGFPHSASRRSDSALTSRRGSMMAALLTKIIRGGRRELSAHNEMQGPIYEPPKANQVIPDFLA